MSSKKSRLNLAIVIVLPLLLCLLAVGTAVIGTTNATQQLEQQQTAWEARAIDDYRMTVIFGSFNYVGQFELEVRDGLMQHNISDASAQNYAQSLGNTFLPSIEDFTIPNIFSFAAEKLESAPASASMLLCNTDTWRYEATYNGEYNYIEHLDHTNCPTGFFCSPLSHCAVNMTIANFEPITTTQQP